MGSLLPMLCVCACSTTRAFMPLEVGREWTYSVVDAYGPRMARLTVREPARVGDQMGVLLLGDDGPSRLAWDGSVLVASEFVGCAFDPPIPLLQANAEASSWEWRGAIRRGGIVSSARVIAAQEAATTDDLGREVPSLRVTLRLNVGGETETVETHYVRGVGIQRQEVRRGGRQVLLVTLATGR
jgi:hypothetical protein